MLSVQCVCYVCCANHGSALCVGYVACYSTCVVCMYMACGGHDLSSCQFINKQTSLLGQGSVDGASCESSEENIIEGETNASKQRLTH